MALTVLGQSDGLEFNSCRAQNLLPDRIRLPALSRVAVSPSRSSWMRAHAYATQPLQQIQKGSPR
jgi:hypothetical protein